MKKTLILFIVSIILFGCISCNQTPDVPVVKKPHLKVMNGNYLTNIYWQITKDGEPETDLYEPFGRKAEAHFYPSEGDGYTIRFYKASETKAKLVDGNLAETMEILQAAETHIEIDHYNTCVKLMDGLTIEIEKSEEI